MYVPTGPEQTAENTCDAELDAQNPKITNILLNESVYDNDRRRL